MNEKTKTPKEKEEGNIDFNDGLYTGEEPDETSSTPEKPSTSTTQQQSKSSISNLTMSGLIIMTLAAVAAPLFNLITCNSCWTTRPPSEQIGCGYCSFAAIGIGVAFFVLGLVIAIVGAIISYTKHRHSVVTASRKTTTYNNSENQYNFWASLILALGLIFSLLGILIMLFLGGGTEGTKAIPWVIVLFSISALLFRFSWAKTKKK